ncbi:MAG TPA: hypothetical protein VL752_16650 [Acidisoma sp.]|uniref:hypothetical protein n=1 Tax=Acidisoma sp. TaxID=1872115 RepID=UPI002C29A576|nr:hypothetical protein [Acidisoma sp.]HTI02581.1 hypothetical protein [Acidisoma sp.]
MRLLASTLAIGTLALGLPLLAAHPADAAQPIGAPVIQADWNGYHHDWHHHWRHEWRGDYDHHWHHHWRRPPPYGYYAPPPPPGYGYGYVYRY